MWLKITNHVLSEYNSKERPIVYIILTKEKQRVL